MKVLFTAVIAAFSLSFLVACVENGPGEAGIMESWGKDYESITRSKVTSITNVHCKEHPSKPKYNCSFSYSTNKGRSSNTEAGFAKIGDKWEVR